MTDTTLTVELSVNIDSQFLPQIEQAGDWQAGPEGPYIVRHRMPPLTLGKFVCELAEVRGSGAVVYRDGNPYNCKADNLEYELPPGPKESGYSFIVPDANGDWHNLATNYTHRYLEDAIYCIQNPGAKICREPIREVFLDLDDTLVHCTPAAMAANGTPIRGEYPCSGSYNIVGATNKMRAEAGFPPVTVAEFWNHCGVGFWSNLKKTPEFEEIIEAAERLVGKYNVCILTAPTLDPDCAAQKVEWIYKNMASHYHRQYLIGPRKRFCASRGRLLIDDSDHNMLAFRKGGGSAVLVPRGWNSLHGRTVSIKEQVEKYFVRA